jgi:quercetin dioxygenase-like cupin family protein
MTDTVGHYREEKMERLKTSKLEAIDILGPQIEFATRTSGDADDYCVMLGIVGAGVFVPLHSHPQRETIFVMTGQLEVYGSEGWRELWPGEVFDIEGGSKHAIRNNTGNRTSVLLISTIEMTDFFLTVGTPLSEREPRTTPSAFAQAAQDRGFWLADADENRLIGLELPAG